MRRRVVITGVGVVSPLGLDAPSTWTALVAGKSGIGPITKFDVSAFSCRIGGEVRGFDPENYIDRKEVKKMDKRLTAVTRKETLPFFLICGFVLSKKVRSYYGPGVDGYAITYHVSTTDAISLRVQRGCMIFRCLI